MLKTLFLFFILISFVNPRKNLTGRNFEFENENELSPDKDIFFGETISNTISIPLVLTSLGSVSNSTVSSLATTTTISLTPYQEPIDILPSVSRSTQTQTTTRTELMGTHSSQSLMQTKNLKDFEFISAQNKSELEKIVAIKCENGGKMDSYIAEILENKCIFLIVCCGPNVKPQAQVYYQPRSNGLKNQAVQARCTLKLLNCQKITRNNGNHR